MATIGLDGPAELFPIRNGLYLGNYAVALAKAQQINVSSPDLKVQRDALMHRANIGLGELDTVISQVSDSDDTPATLRVCDHDVESQSMMMMIASKRSMIIGVVFVYYHVFDRS